MSQRSPERERRKAKTSVAPAPGCVTPYLLAAPAAALLLIFLAAPVGFLVRVSLSGPSAGRGFVSPGTWTARPFAELTDADGLRLLAFTAAFGTVVAAVSVVLAYPAAVLVASLPGRWGRAAVAAVLLPKLAGPIATLFGLRQLLASADAVAPLNRTVVGAAVGEVYLILPYAVLVLAVQLWRIDPTLAAAARGLGATRWGAFRQVTLPLSRPGAVLAGQLALGWGLGAFLGPLLLGGPAETTLSVEAHRQGFEYSRWPRAATVAVLLTALSAAALAGYALLTRRLTGGRR